MLGKRTISACPAVVVLPLGRVAAEPVVHDPAFAANRDGDWEIFVMDADGGNVTQLTNNTSDDCYPAWCPVQ